MRSIIRNILRSLPMVLMALVVAGPSTAGSLDGTIKLGGIQKDETDGSDLSVMQETYNIYDGFNVSQIRLNSRFGSKHQLNLDLNEVNLDSRRGRFAWRYLGIAELTARYDRFRQLYDRDGSTASERENWRLGGKITPTDWLRVVGNYSLQTRSGDRLGEPEGTNSFLGTTYDYDLQTGFFEAEANSGARAFAVGYEMSRFKDNELAEADREGDIISARLSGPGYFLPNVSHFLRGAYGTQKLTAVDTEYKIGNLQYLGIYRPGAAWQVKYRFLWNRVDNDVTSLKTDNIRNDFDLVWYNGLGSVFGGYGYVTNDDDRSLTENNVWRIGTNVGYLNWVKAKVSYASADKTDQENLTLLKDIESSRFRATLKSQPTDPLTLGVGYVDRVREFPIIQVKATGQRYNAYGRWMEQGLGALNIDFAYSVDDYDDLDGGFKADNTTITGRLDFTRVKDLRLSFGLTWLDIGTNLDIEKSILSFEGEYAFLDDWFVEAKYNVYNYDDYVLLDKYYTANVIWLNLGYNISLGQ